MNKDSTPESEARVWLERLYCRTPDSIPSEEFRKWLAASPANAQAYRRLEQLWRDLPLLDGAEWSLPRRSGRASGRFRAGWWMPATAAAAAILIAIAVWQPAGLTRETVLETAVGESRSVTLADGSEITLAPGTVLSIRMSRSQRDIGLSSGQAFFDVAHDASRPFIVESAGTQVRVLGTMFDLRRGPSSIEVAVVDGRVEVVDRLDARAPDHDEKARLVLERGQKVSATLDGALGVITTIHLDRAADWRSGRLRYDDATLLDVVADINRYSETPIEFGDKALERIRVTAAFEAADWRETMETIAISHGLKLHADGNRLRLARR